MYQTELSRLSIREIISATEEIVDTSREKMFELMKKERDARIREVYQVVQANVGDYIALSGKVHVNGFNNLNKCDFYQIVEVLSDGLLLKGHQRDEPSFLPMRHFNQKCIILDEEGYQKI